MKILPKIIGRQEVKEMSGLKKSAFEKQLI